MKIKHKYTGKSLLELKEKFGMGKGGFYNFWWKDESFAKDKAPKGIYEIDFDNINLNLTFEEQRSKIRKGFEIIHPAILAEAILEEYKKTGEYLCKDYYLRTSLSSDAGNVYAGNVSCVGSFDGDGLDVSGWGCSRDYRVGVGASRKLKSLDTFDSSVLDRLGLIEAKIDKIKEIL